MTEQQRQQRAREIRAWAIEQGERRRRVLRENSPARLDVPAETAPAGRRVAPFKIGFHA